MESCWGNINSNAPCQTDEFVNYFAIYLCATFRTLQLAFPWSDLFYQGMVTQTSLLWGLAFCSGIANSHDFMPKDCCTLMAQVKSFCFQSWPINWLDRIFFLGYLVHFLVCFVQVLFQRWLARFLSKTAFLWCGLAIQPVAPATSLLWSFLWCGLLWILRLEILARSILEKL